MTTKHTPGPWKFAENHESGFTTKITTDNGMTELHIAEVTGSLQLFNARLIATAPELLEALQMVVVLASADTASVKARLDKASSIARAAIAKAKGE